MEPTYRTETDEDDRPRYICLLCAGTASEYWSPDEELMRQHQANRHGGQMIPAQEPAASQEDETQRQGETPASSDPSVPPTAQEPSPEGEHAATTEEPGATADAER